MIRKAVTFLLDTFIHMIVKKASWKIFPLWRSANKIHFLQKNSDYTELFPLIKMELPDNSPLATQKEKYVHLYLDDIISPHVIRKKEWALETNKLLLSFCSPKKDLYLVDIGANIGLFTRQMIILSPNVKQAFCFEPLRANHKVLELNLASFNNVKIYPYGIAAENTDTIIYLDHTNSGNVSMSPSMFPDEYSCTEAIQTITVNSKEFPYQEITSRKNISVIYKSDTQGFDEQILTYFPLTFWDHVECILIEVCQLKDKHVNYQKLRQIAEIKFGNIYDATMKRETSYAELETFSKQIGAGHKDFIFYRSL